MKQKEWEEVLLVHADGHGLWSGILTFWRSLPIFARPTDFLYKDNSFTFRWIRNGSVVFTYTFPGLVGEPVRWRSFIAAGSASKWKIDERAWGALVRAIKD